MAATPPLELVLVASATPVSETEKEALEIAIACGGSSSLQVTAYKVAPPPGYDAVTFLQGRPR